MKKIISSLVLTSLAMSCSTNPLSVNSNRSTASSDRHRPDYGGRYDGPPPEFKRDQWERNQSGFSICEKYKNETGKHVLACGAGIEEAKMMANKFAGSHGREDGYLRGYAWGLNQATHYYQNSTEEMLRGEAQVDSLSSYLDFAVPEGRDAGSRDGNSLGASEAKGRYYRAVDTKIMPSSQVQTPSTNFTPTQDAYSRYVGRIPTVEEILRKSRYGRLGFYDSYDRNYSGGRDWQEKNGRDLWNNDGRYNVNSSRWVDGNFAFERWSEISKQGRSKYDSLNKISMNEDVNGRFPAQEVPPRNGNGSGRGNGGGGTRPAAPATPATPATPAAPTAPAAPVVDYQAIFKEAFVQAYNSFAPMEYSRAYHSAIDDGQSDGESVGYEVGSEIAQKIGLARAFNAKYAKLSYNNYQTAFVDSYSQSFNSTFNFFRTNPVLSLNFIGLVGSEDNGVVEPGETFGVKFKVINAGGVSTNLKYTIEGDVENAKSLNDSVAPISSKIITSPSIGDVLSTLEDGSTGSYTLTVNNLKESLWQAIKRPIEISDIANNLSPLDGAGLYNISISNISSVPVNGKIGIELKINGSNIKSILANPMQAGEKTTYALDFKGLDPLVWITSNYNVEITLKYNDKIFGKKSAVLRIGNTTEMLAKYFSRLANEKAVFPESRTLDSRLAEVKDMLIKRNAQDVLANVDSSGNVYRTTPENTVAGQILAAKDSYANNSTRAIAEFTSLADVMAPESKKFKSFLFIHPKKDAYLELMKKIGGKKY